MSLSISHVKSLLVLPSLLCRRSWKKWWSGSTPRLTVRTRAARAKELQPRRVLHQWHQSPKRKSSSLRSSLLQRSCCSDVTVWSWPWKGDYDTRVFIWKWNSFSICGHLMLLNVLTGHPCVLCSCPLYISNLHFIVIKRKFQIISCGVVWGTHP